MAESSNRTITVKRVFIVCLLFIVANCLLPTASFSQTATDSTTINFEKQANANKIAMGMDTLPLLPVVEDTTTTVNKGKSLRFVDSSKTSLNPVVVHSLKKRKFYWNAANYSTEDSSLGAKKLRRHNTLYAALFSMALPGLGQAYNRKYWKIPIVYAGLGGLGYACYYTATNFTGYRNAYRAQVATVPDYNASYKGVSDPATLKEYRDYFKKNLDISAICTGVWYILNIVDATVDAHLFEWNMKDDIHLSWQPVMLNNSSYASTAPGLSFNLSF